MQWEWERLCACARNPHVPPLLRFYSWQPWAVSLGMHQREELLDPEQCRRYGITVVRRPTGGRAVLHAEEVTYAVIVRLSHGRTPQELYRRIHERIAAAISGLIGRAIAPLAASADFRRLWNRRLAAACFASSARSELAVNGRKLVGSAQRLLHGVLLQHGSILLGDAHVLLAELIAVESEAERAALRSFLAEHSISLARLLGRPVAYDEVVAALRESFCGVTFPQQRATVQSAAFGSGSSSA